jgi:hypothetical protein
MRPCRTLRMSGRTVIAFRRMDSFSSISCEDRREAEAKERRLEHRKRGIFRRERRRAKSQDSSSSPVDTRRSASSRGRKKEVRRMLSTPSDRNISLPTAAEPEVRLSLRCHSSSDSKNAQERWGSRAKRTLDGAPPRCLRKVSMQLGTDCDDDGEYSMTTEGNSSGNAGPSRWESDPTSTCYDFSPNKTKIRRSRTWCHSGDTESCDTRHLFLFSPPRLPSRKNSDQQLLEELVNALSHGRIAC